MKSKHIALMFASLVLLLAVTANAQIRANSDEDKAYRKLAAEKNPDTQLVLCQEFEKQFPQSKVLADVLLMAVDIYTAKDDKAKIAEYGEKTLKVDPQNVSALVAVSRVYAIERKNLEVAVSYAQKAVDNVEKMKKQSVPTNYSEAEWKQLIKDNEQMAQQQLDYSKAVRQ